MSADYIFHKDSTRILEETIEDEDLASAVIKWQLVEIGTDLSGDLDALTGVLTKTTAGGGITIPGGSGEVFRVSFDPADSENIVPDDYWCIRRVTLVGGETLALPKYTVTVGV